MTSIFVFMLQSFNIYPLKCKWNAAFVAFLKPGEIHVVSYYTEMLKKY